MDKDHDTAWMAWAAGLFEGEGCVTLTGGRYNYPAAILVMTDRDVVERFADVIGASVVESRWKGAPSHWKPRWKVHVQGRERVRELYLQFSPYLGKRRLERFQDILKTSDETKIRLDSTRRERMQSAYRQRSIDPITKRFL